MYKVYTKDGNEVTLRFGIDFREALASGHYTVDKPKKAEKVTSIRTPKAPKKPDFFKKEEEQSPDSDVTNATD